MTTPETPAEAIADHFRLGPPGISQVHIDQGQKIIDTLTAAGYAVVRLPGQRRHAVTGRPGWWDAMRPIEADQSAVLYDGHTITATEARALAAALLAAANHQENNR